VVLVPLSILELNKVWSLLDHGAALRPDNCLDG
jgi:hypothetical protein